MAVVAYVPVVATTTLGVVAAVVAAVEGIVLIFLKHVLKSLGLVICVISPDPVPDINFQSAVGVVLSENVWP